MSDQDYLNACHRMDMASRSRTIEELRAQRDAAQSENAALRERVRDPGRWVVPIVNVFGDAVLSSAENVPVTSENAGQIILELQEEVSVIPNLRAEIAALRDVVRIMDEALADALGGWRYIRANHGDLYGVGWDRVHLKIDAARSAAAGVLGHACLDP